MKLPAGARNPRFPPRQVRVLPPLPPTASIAARGAAPALPYIIAGAIFCFLGLIAAPDIAAWIASMRPAPVQTSAQMACPRPSEHETLLVYINADAEGRLRMSCAHVGSRGAYSRGRR